MEMPSKYETLKINLLLSCRLSQESANCCVAVVLLLYVEMRRGAFYLYYFATQKITGADFTWGSNIILYFISLIAGFSPQSLHCSF